jgi:ribosomal protein S18 acetylase RimI-like enzyme
MARAETETVGFGCAWVEEDDDPLLRDDARTYGYVSDIFVEGAWRRQGIALQLLDALEMAMRSRGCHRIRICSKAVYCGPVLRHPAELLPAVDLGWPSMAGWPAL